MDLRGVFNSEPKSLFDSVSEAGLCYYLPAYQRPYSWNRKNIDRVFEDVIHGIENAIRNEDSITFIGTLLAIHDTKFLTIVPHKKGEVPSKVMLVIDGQQRLTTMLIIMTALHEFLSVKQELISKEYDNILKEIEGNDGDEALKQRLNDIDWILDKLNQEIANLRYYTTDTNSNRDKTYRWYPKLIRAYKDCWSKTKNGAQYESPIAKYLHEYNAHVLDCEEKSKFKVFNYKIEKNHDSYDKHQIIIKNLRVIKRHIRQMSIASDNDYDFPAISELMKGEFKDSFQFDVPNNYILPSDQPTIYDQVLNLIVFSKYLLNRVCVTYVTVIDETYAFDMFEALNTTGEPLTSIETFKPKVIEEEGLSEYESSESKKYFDIIDGFLDSISDASKKHKETTRIMLAFALSETGEKISKHISDQRRYLIDSYKEEDSQTKIGFVKNLSNTTRFYYEEWDKSTPNIFNDPESETNQLLLCFDVLRKSNHEITVPLLVRFYSNYIDAVNKPLEDGEKEVTKNELIKAIKAIVAFFVLWRSSHLNTSGIDTVYRELLKKGDDALGLGAFSRCSTDVLSAKALGLFLRDKLKTKLNANDDDLKEKWVSQSVNIPVYSVSVPLSRIMMLSAFNDTCPSKDEAGFIDSGTVGSNTMLSWHKWKLFGSDTPGTMFTLEHVAPQTLTEDWGVSLTEDINLIDTIGNLTILPSSANSSASNKSWKEKKKYYDVLCQENKRQQKKMLEEFTENQQAILEKTPYLGFLEPISKVEEWDAKFIKKRSRNLLTNIWDTLEPWLGAD